MVLFRNKLLNKAQSDELRPITKFQMIHELETCAEKIEKQRLDYASKKAEHEHIIEEMMKLQSASKEELDSYNIQIDQTAAMLKLFAIIFILFINLATLILKQD